MEFFQVVFVGLQNSGKTTLLQILSNKTPARSISTIGLKVCRIKIDDLNFNIKCWDLGGQSQYRSEWSQYVRGCDCIVYIVDSNAIFLFPDAKHELHRLLDDNKELATKPLLVISNKIDLEPHASESILIKGIVRLLFIILVSFRTHISFLSILELNLDGLDNPWTVIQFSVLKTVHLSDIVQWLIERSGVSTKRK